MAHADVQSACLGLCVSRWEVRPLQTRRRNVVPRHMCPDCQVLLPVKEQKSFIYLFIFYTSITLMFLCLHILFFAVSLLIYCVSLQEC